MNHINLNEEHFKKTTYAPFGFYYKHNGRRTWFSYSDIDKENINEYLDVFSCVSEKRRILFCGSIKDYNRNFYYLKVWYYTEKNISDKKGFCIDHIVPIIYGYKKGIPADLIGSKENLQYLSLTENLRKGISINKDAELILKKWYILV